MADVNFERKDKGPYTIIKFLKNDLDFSLNSELKTQFEYCRRDGKYQVILDLSNCRTIQSEGIGLITYYWQSYQTDWKLFFVISGENVIERLKTCTIYNVIQNSILPSLEEAESKMRLETANFEAIRDGKPLCPVCNGSKIEAYDKGFRRYFRMIRRKPPRRVCIECKTVFR